MGTAAGPECLGRFCLGRFLLCLDCGWSNGGAFCGDVSCGAAVMTSLNVNVNMKVQVSSCPCGLCGHVMWLQMLCLWFEGLHVLAWDSVVAMEFLVGGASLWLDAMAVVAV